MRVTRIVCLLGLAGAAAMAQREEVGKGVNFYSIEKEIALGKELAEEFRRGNRMVESPVAAAYVNELGQRLVKEIGGPAFSYTFEIVADDPTAAHEVAAFPGGFLFVPSSLILAAKDEDEFAGMLAHGVAHVAARHGTKVATKAEIANIAAAPLIYMGGWTGYAMRQGNEQALPMAMVQAWRRLELDADGLAVKAMAAVGYDPAALVRYLERQQEDAARRVAALRAVIEGLPAKVYGEHDGWGRVQDAVRRK